MQDQAEQDYTSVVTAAMLWDMLPADAVPPLCAEAGVPVPDADGAAFEAACSHARRQAIRQILPWIEVLSVIGAEIGAIAAIRPAGPHLSPLGAQQLREARDRYEMTAHDIALPIACAITGLLVERGFLQVTDRGRTATLDAFIGT